VGRSSGWERGSSGMWEAVHAMPHPRVRQLAGGNAGPSVCMLPAGLAGLLLSRYRLWPVLMPAATVAHVAFDTLVSHKAVATSLFLTSAGDVEACTGAHLLHRVLEKVVSGASAILPEAHASVTRTSRHQGEVGAAQVIFTQQASLVRGNTTCPRDSLRSNC
jgi:hypothetical protein